MTDLTDFKRTVYEPEVRALRKRVANQAAALLVATRGCTRKWTCGAIFHVHGCPADKGQCDQSWKHAP
jgi:hypothetical protein